MTKLKVAVLFGGCSSEYEVSLQSAYSVISHLDPGKYEPILIGITSSGEWFQYIGDPEKIKDGTWSSPADCVRAILSPCRETHGLLEPATGKTIRLDAAMPILHGKNGEDGTVQGLLELSGIPVVGCNTLSSALCMDKDRAHKLVSLTGIQVPQSYSREQIEQIKYPVFVKPVKAGSSFGITKVHSKDELPAAIKLALGYDDDVIIEENIPGIEIGCAVLGNEDLIVGELDEIELTDGFFDFREKYTLETSAIHVPARIPPQKADKIKDAAKRIYKALGCTGFARVDVFLTPSGEIVFNEVNTIPGFTVNSRYPKMMQAAGMTLEQVIDRAIELAVGK